MENTYDKITMALRRIPMHFRIASDAQLKLLEIAKETGICVSNIIESVVVEYLKHYGKLKLPFESIRNISDVVNRLEKLNTNQIFKLLSIDLKAKKKSFDFVEETKINIGSPAFQYFDSKSLIAVFQNYYLAKKLTIPSVEDLIKTASAGYKYPWLMGQTKTVNMSDTELKEVLFVLTQSDVSI